MNDLSGMVSSEKRARNYGIDGLRILAMMMVIILHLLGQGGVLDRTAWMSGQYQTAWFLEIAAYCAVNCYALISGYVGINGKYKYYNIVLLWLRVVFYTLGITLIFSLCFPGTIDLRDWVKAVLPVSGGYYWYFTSYFALFFFIPLLNTAISRMTQKQLGALVIGLIAVFSGMQTLLCREIFGTSSNAWWLMILYMIGGYIGRYGLWKKQSKGLLLLGYLGAVVLTWLSKMLIEAGKLPFLDVFGSNYLVNNTSLTILVSSIFLLLLFERLHTSRTADKVIRFFAPMSFSVYLIHANPLVWDHILVQRFAGYGEYPVWLEVLSVLLTALAIYLLCSLVDLLRERIFQLLKLKQRLANLEERCLGNLWN